MGIVFPGDFDPSSRASLIGLTRHVSLLICTCGVLDPPGSSAEFYAHHTPPPQIGEIAAAAGVRPLLLSHLSPPIVAAQDRVRQSIARAYAGDIRFATDLLRVRPAR